MSEIRDRYKRDVGDWGPKDDSAGELVPEMMYLLGARAVIDVLKARGPDGLVEAIWKLEPELNQDLTAVMAETRKRMKPAEMLRYQMDLMRLKDRLKG
jgi:hypothetical protein